MSRFARFRSFSSYIFSFLSHAQDLLKIRTSMQEKRPQLTPTYLGWLLFTHPSVVKVIYYIPGIYEEADWYLRTYFVSTTLTFWYPHSIQPLLLPFGFTKIRESTRSWWANWGQTIYGWILLSYFIIFYLYLFIFLFSYYIIYSSKVMK